MPKRKNNPDQPELPISGTQKGNSSPGDTPRSNGKGNGETHVLAEQEAAATVAHAPFEPGKIQLPFHRRVDTSFLQYASYVIRDRAIPNLEDGLKPVQRRILWSLHEKDDGRFIKVATISGHCAQYHPHGEAAIGDALVVLTSKRYVIEGQGSSRVGDTTLTWQPRDIFVAPSWAPVSHEALEDVVLFSFSDRPVQKALGLWREEKLNG